MTYTTVSLVAAELNGANINTTTVPATSTVNNWIDEAKAEIDLRTNKVWEAEYASSTYLDGNGGKYLRLPFAPVIEIDEIKREVNGLGAEESWETLEHGRNKDFILHVMDGEIEFINKAPSFGSRNVCVSYIYGYAEVPPYITRLATLIVASRVIQATINDSAGSGGGSVSVGNISITDPSSFSISHYRSIRDEINDIYGRIGDSFVFRPTRNYEMRS